VILEGLLVSPLSSVTAALRRRRGIPTVILAVAALAWGTACGDSPSEPMRSLTAAPSLDLNAANTPLTPAQGLLRTTPLSARVVVVKTIPSGGGGIDVPGTDFQLQVPNGAFVGKSMTITIIAYPGNVVAYDFQPHGTVFLKPLKAVQQLGHTNWKSFNLPAGFYPNWSGAYFATPSQIDLVTGRALINEFMPGGVSVGGATMTWSIPHFSGYMVAVGQESRGDQ
jgi:hypothetical protein